MNQYVHTLYLIGCYMVVADKEINALEVDVLDNILLGTSDPELDVERSRIFSDAEEKADYYQLLNRLLLVCQNNEQKERAIRYLAQVAIADGFIGSQKESIIKDVAVSLHVDPTEIVREEEKLAAENQESARLSRMMRLWGKVEKVYYDTLANKSKQHTLDKMFGGLAFQSVLEGITDQALIDYERIEKLMSLLEGSLQQTRTEVTKLSSRMKSEKKELEDVHKVLNDIVSHLNELIDVSLVKNKEMLDKKQRNIRFFTIAFMGRTKAGKSTLHKVMTQENSDDIGVGKLRTTRYNRSWYWDKLRIVDTPGIGAPGGEVDTNIAKSIIDEADLVCYVVTNDSIQETEFNFFDTIKEHNKPLYIILNVKSNLSDSKRLDKFLEDPTKWKETQGRESLQGHIDRIHDKLDGKYNMNAVKIIPIHLLAAQLATCSNLEKSIAEILLKGSNFLEFTNSVKSEVFDSGCLKKSLSVVEGSAYQIHYINKCIQQDYQILLDNKEILSRRYEKYKKFLVTESSLLISDVRTYYETCKKSLHNRAASFASEHYDDKEAGKKWGNDTRVCSILSDLNERINSRVGDFQHKSKTELEELFSDIKFSFEATSSSNASGEDVVNTRLGVGIVGALIGAATPVVLAACMSNPVGWVILGISLGVGIVITWIKSLFTSKEEKVKQATEKLKSQLIADINESMETNRSKGVSELTKMTADLKKNIDMPFSEYITNVDVLLSSLKELMQKADFDEKVVNALVGFRILDFVNKAPVKDKNVSDLTNEILVGSYMVDRDWNSHTLTYRYPVKCTEKQIAKAEAATQMTIKITQ